MVQTKPVELVAEKDGKVLHRDLIPEPVKRAEYAVRGDLYLRAMELKREGMKIIFSNVGNPQTLGQKPLTFNRQVLALCSAPYLIDDPDASKLFPSDAIARAKEMLGFFGGSGIGAYTDALGAMGIRQEVADFISARDGHPANVDHVSLTVGASAGIKTVLQLLIRGEMDSILVPIPQYPLYSASITLQNGTFVGYNLQEKSQWSMDMDDLQSLVDRSSRDSKAVRGMVVINPGNPTGQCLSVENLERIVRFCVNNRIVLMADEVYQPNIYQQAKPFVSLHKVAMDMGEPYSSRLELVSFHTVSKGVYGECGLRGGYMHTLNLDPKTTAAIYKLASINLCPNTVGQIAVGLMCNEPKPGQPSYDQFMSEKQAILDALKRKADMMTDFCNSLSGVTCNSCEGAMYVFPKLDIPHKAVQAAQEMGKAPDFFYCLKLLEATGISTIPGSGFQQAPNTLHLRTTILPDEGVMKDMMKSWRAFHEEFMAKYS